MPRDLRAISRNLGERYVVQGSVRASADHVRVTAQPIDTTTGGNVRAENFDRQLTAHVDTQARVARVARAVVTCLAPQIDRPETEQIWAMPIENLTARVLALRRRSAISTGEMGYQWGPRDQAADLARRALALDLASNFAGRVLAWVAGWHVYHATTASVPQALADGIDAASRAIAANPTDHHARRLHALLHFRERDAEARLPELRQAQGMVLNCAVTLAWLGLDEGIHGDAGTDVAPTEAARRRSPRDPARGSLLAALGFAHFAVRNYGTAAEAAEAAPAGATGSATPLILAAIAWVRVGRNTREAAVAILNDSAAAMPWLSRTVDARHCLAVPGVHRGQINWRGQAKDGTARIGERQVTNILAIAKQRRYLLASHHLMYHAPCDLPSGWVSGCAAFGRLCRRSDRYSHLYGDDTFR